jgi:hypothetical protein
VIGCEDDTGVIRSAQSIRRSEASAASRKLGVAFFGHADIWIMPTSLGIPLSQAAICPIVSA